MPLTEPTEEIIHDIVVKDPYRWLEDRSLPETEAWIRNQQRECDRYFSSCSELGAIERRVREYLDVEVIDQPGFVANRYFYRKRSVGEEQGRICTRDISTGEESVLVEPSPGDQYSSVGIYRVSLDGMFLAYEVKHGGSDRKEIRFVDVNTVSFLPENIPQGYARGLAFSANGFFYCHETAADAHDHAIRYQSFGSNGLSRAVFQVPRTKGSRLVLKANAHRLGALRLHPEGSELLMDFWIADLVDDTPNWIGIFRNRRAPYGPILCHDRILALAGTDSNSSKLIELSAGGKEIGIVVPARETAIQQIAITQDRIFVSYFERGAATIDSWFLNGKRADSVNLPKSISTQFLPLYTENTDRFFFTLESFDIPPAIYQHHAETNASVLWHQQRQTKGSGRSLIQRTTVQSRDGTQIPLTLVSAKRSEVPTPRPVIMTSYGGFGVSMTPKFSVFVAIMLELGAVFVVPHIRGGGDLGRAWHDAGRARNRQASFNDFIAAAEWLCDQGITTPAKLAIFGGSNSGLLVGSVMTQRPDLFRVVLSIAPLLDMVRYESFDQAAKWAREYGSVEDSADFQSLYGYSPYHHIAEKVDYPATLFVTGDQDDRCNPAHVRKMAAFLKGRPAQKSPVIVDYSKERGHCPVLPLSVRIRALARRIAFICRELEIPICGGAFDETIGF